MRAHGNNSQVSAPNLNKMTCTPCFVQSTSSIEGCNKAHLNHLFKTNSYKYDDPFGNKHTYLFSHGRVDIHPDKLSPNLETCQESMEMTSKHDDNHSKTPKTPSTENTHNNKSILSIQDLVIIHDITILFPKKSKDDVKAYKHLHGIDMQIHSIPKAQKQKNHNMGLSDLHE
jgi:hypothetical protein